MLLRVCTGATGYGGKKNDIFKGLFNEVIRSIPGMLWMYPGIHSGRTRVYTLDAPGYILWIYPGIYPGMTNTTKLGIRVPQSKDVG